MTSPYINHPVIDKMDKYICGCLGLYHHMYMRYIRSGEVPPADVVTTYLLYVKHFRAHMADWSSLRKRHNIKDYTLWNMYNRLKGLSPTGELSEDALAEGRLFGAHVDVLINTSKRKRRRKVLTMVARALNKIDVLEAFLPREVGMHVISF